MSVTPSAQSARRAAHKAAEPTPLSLPIVAASEVASDSEALSHIARRLAEMGRDAAAARELLASGAAALLAAEGALVARTDESDFCVIATAGSLTPMAGFNAPVAASLAEEAVACGEAVALNDAAHDPRVDAHFLTAFAPRQIAIAPIMIGQESFGFSSRSTARGADQFHRRGASTAAR